MELIRKCALAAACLMLFTLSFDCDLFTGSHNASGVDMTSDATVLFSQWLLRNYSGGLDGKRHVVNTESDRMVLKYDANYIAALTHNDTLLWSDKFSIEKGKSIYSADSLDFIIYKNKTPDVIIYLSGDTLVLGDNMVDGYESLYSKIN